LLSALRLSIVELLSCLAAKVDHRCDRDLQLQAGLGCGNGQPYAMQCNASGKALGDLQSIYS
jgi:hypothetical protein